MGKILIIDGNNHFHRAYHKFKGLSNGKVSTAAIFGLPYIVNSLIKKFNPDDLYIIWDGGSDIRKKIYPEYKAKRKKYTEEESKEFFRQRQTCIKIFKVFGVKQIYKKGIEADDYIYMLTKKLVKQDNKVIIVSNDKDFNQLASSKISIWNDIRNLLITPKNMKRMYGYEPHQCSWVLTIGGDKSDNIKGLRGYGEGSKGLIEFIITYPTIHNFWLSNQRNPRKEQIQEVIKTNWELVDLKDFYNHHLKGKVKLRKLSYAWDTEMQEKYAEKYKIKTFIKPEFKGNFLKLFKLNNRII